MSDDAMSPESIKRIRSRIQPVKSTPKVLSMLVYGRSGTGKTTFAGTWPKPALVLDVNEKGTDSISNVEGVDVIQINEWQDFEDLYWYIKSSGSQYKTVVIDQVTSMQEMACAQAMADKDKSQMSQQLWGIAGGYMKTWLVNYRNLTDDGINVLFIAHDRTTKGDEDSSTEDQIDPSIGPRVMPSVATLLNGAVKVIAQSYVREVFDEDKERVIEFCHRIAPHPYFITKMRNPPGTNIPESVVNPTYDQILSLMTSGLQPKIRRKLNETQS